MQRIFGAIAIFLGWLSLGLGVMAGLVQSQFFGLNHKEDALPPMDVYGITGAVVLWIFVGAAILLAVPMATAMVAPDPRRNLRILALGMAVTGLALAPDELGRFFGLPVIAGAVAVWLGGELIHQETVAAAMATGSRTGFGPGEPATAGPATAPTAPMAGATAPETLPVASVPPFEPIAATAPLSSTTPAQAAPTETKGRRKKAPAATSAPTATPERICPWCSSAVPANATSCPSCQAILDTDAGDAIAVAGVTEVSPELQQYVEKVRAGKSRTSILSMIFNDPPVAPVLNAPEPSDADALRPPSAELKAEMARLDAEIAAGAVHPDEAGPYAVEDAGAPAGTDAASDGTTPDDVTTPDATTPKD